MAVNKRKGSSVYQYEFQHKGVRYRGSTGLHTQAAAREFELNEKRRVRENVNLGITDSMTWGEALDRYWDTVYVLKAKPEQANKYLSVFKKLRNEIGPDFLIDGITTPYLSGYQAKLLNGSLRGKPLKPASINRQFDDIRAILTQAHKKWGCLAKLPEVPRLPVSNERTRYLSEAEEVKLLKEATPHIRDFIIFCIGTGARKSEATGLLWRDVDFESQSGVVKFMDTKNGTHRGVNMSKKVRALLERLHKAKPDDVGHVFTLDGKPAGEPKKAFERAVKRAGLYLPEGNHDNVTPHVLRHTFASRLVMKGATLYDVSKLLGHAKISMTQRYAHLAPERLEAAIALLD